MKKISIEGAKPSQKISRQKKLTVGLDLGDRNSWYCVLDEPLDEIYKLSALSKPLIQDWVLQIRPGFIE